MWRTHVHHSVADQHVRGNNVIHFVADPQVMEMYATNIPESYSCPAVDKE